MTILRLVTIFVMVLLTLLAWLVWPVYQFYGHRDMVPLTPFGWSELPAQMPTAQTVHVASYENAAAQALSVLQDHRERLQLPSLSAAIAIDGQLVWAGAVGWQDVASRAPATANTMYRIGSTSKALTATALARLLDRDIIELDTPISAYMESLPNPQWGNITPRMLASHMSGMPHYKENTDRVGQYKSVALGTHYANMTDAVEVFDGSDLLFAPGTEFHYSSLGTVLLGAIMGEAADSSYRTLVKDLVLDPLSMEQTIIAPPTASDTPDMATAYKRRSNAFRPWRPVDQTHRLPGGGWAASSSDLARMGMAWLDSRYISPATREQFWTPQKLASGETNPQDYAIGFRVRDYAVDGIRAWNANHGGVSRGGLSWLLIFPEHDMALAFNTNAKTASGAFSDFGIIWQDLFKAFARPEADAIKLGVVTVD